MRDPVCELALGGVWVDVSTDCYDGNEFVIRRGRGGETSQATPSSCGFALTNRDNKYAPRNPLGPYFGQFGRNTPSRVALRLIKHAFANAVSGGWGSTDQNPQGPTWTVAAWSTAGAGGTVQASDFNVASGVATHSVPATNAHRRTYLSSTVYRNVDQAITVSLPFTNVTGAPIEISGLVARGVTS